MLLGRAPVEEDPCTPVPTNFDPSSQSAGLTYRNLSPQTDKPYPARDLPAGFDRSCYYVMKGADKQALLVMNLSTKPRPCVDVDEKGTVLVADKFQYG